MKLTSRNITSLEFQGSQTIFWDDEVPSFGVRVYPSGQKSYVYRVYEKGRRTIRTIGSVALLSTEDARKMALLMAAEHSIMKNTGQAIFVPFWKLAEDYIADYAMPRKKTWKKDVQYIRRFLMPKFEKKNMRDITPADCERLHVELGYAKHQANRVLQVLSSMFECAIRWGYCEKNPARLVKHYHERKRTRYVKVDEFPILLDAIKQEPFVTRVAFLLLILLGCRKGDLLRAQWPEVDWERHTLTLRKTKSGEDIVVQLSDDALQLLNILAVTANSEYIIPGPAGKKRFGLDSAWKRVRERSNLTDLRVHDLRRTFATYVSSKGYSDRVIADMLGHVNVNSVNAYVSRYNPRKREVAEDYAGMVKNLQ